MSRNSTHTTRSAPPKREGQGSSSFLKKARALSILIPVFTGLLSVAWGFLTDWWSVGAQLSEHQKEIDAIKIESTTSLNRINSLGKLICADKIRTVSKGADEESLKLTIKICTEAKWLN